MNKFFCILLLICFGCKAVRLENSKNSFTEPVNRASVKLELVCYRIVNQKEFDFPTDECEDSLDSLSNGFTSSGKFYLSESEKSRVIIKMKLVEKETNSKLLKYLNLISIGFIPEFANIHFHLQLKATDYMGNILYEGEISNSIEITWNIFYLFHAPFLNPDAVARETLVDMSQKVSDKVKLE